MNYAIVAVGAIVIITLVIWSKWGRNVYHGPVKQIDLVDPAKDAADRAAVEAAASAAAELGRLEDDEILAEAESEAGEGSRRLGG